MVDGHQHTVAWSVDDFKSVHENPKMDDESHKWLQEKYGDQSINVVKAVRGKRHA